MKNMYSCTKYSKVIEDSKKKKFISLTHLSVRRGALRDRDLGGG